MKIGLEYIDPYSFALLRLLAAFILSASVLLTRERPKLDILRSRPVWVLGLLNAAGFMLQFVGMTYTTATRAALIANSNVTFTALLGWRLNKDPMGAGQAIALPVAIVGIYLITTGGDLSNLSGGQVTGDLLVLLAGLAWSFFLVINKRVVSQEDSNVTETVTWVMLVTTLGILPFALAFGDIGRVQVVWQGWVAVAFTAVFCTLLPYLLFSKAQRFVTVTLSALVLLIEIVAAFVSSALILGEQLSPINGVGAVLVCVSIVLASRGSGER
jgi:drug/metabolite transporter (DMT)-like permease